MIEIKEVKHVDIAPVNEIMRFNTYEQMLKAVDDYEIDENYLWSCVEGEDEHYDKYSRFEDWTYGAAFHRVNVIYWFVGDKPFEGIEYVETLARELDTGAIFNILEQEAADGDIVLPEGLRPDDEETINAIWADRFTL